MFQRIPTVVHSTSKSIMTWNNQPFVFQAAASFQLQEAVEELADSTRSLFLSLQILHRAPFIQLLCNNFRVSWVLIVRLGQEAVSFVLLLLSVSTLSLIFFI